MHKAIEDILPRNQTGAKKELEKLSSIIDFAVDFWYTFIKMASRQNAKWRPTPSTYSFLSKYFRNS